MDKRPEVVKGQVKFDCSIGTTTWTERLRSAPFAATSRFFLLHARKVVEKFIVYNIKP